MRHPNQRLPLPNSVQLPAFTNERDRKNYEAREGMNWELWRKDVISGEQCLCSRYKFKRECEAGKVLLGRVWKGCTFEIRYVGANIHVIPEND
jgi:hypothetical protein